MAETPQSSPLEPRSIADVEGPPEKHDVTALHDPIMREKLEPRDGYEPVPLWLVTIFGALLFWGGWYLATYSGGFRGDILDENPAARYAGMSGPAQRETDPMALGQRLYSGNCVSCHQQNGEGVAGQYPPLAGSEWVKGSPARAVRIILHGLEGPITVKGVTYGSAAMPAFGAKFSDSHIAAVLTYIRAQWGNAASAVGVAEVAAARAATQGRSTPWSEAELLAITKEDVAPQDTPRATQPAATRPSR